MLLAIFATIFGTLLFWFLFRSVVYLVKFSEERAKGNHPPFFPNKKACERCENQVARSERVKSVREYLFGGWTCPNCGSEYDQVDNLRVARSHDEHLRDTRERNRKKVRLAHSKDGKTPVERMMDE